MQRSSSGLELSLLNFGGGCQSTVGNRLDVPHGDSCRCHRKSAHTAAKSPESPRATGVQSWLYATRLRVSPQVTGCFLRRPARLDETWSAAAPIEKVRVSNPRSSTKLAGHGRCPSIPNQGDSMAAPHLLRALGPTGPRLSTLLGQSRRLAGVLEQLTVMKTEKLRDTPATARTLSLVDGVVSLSELCTNCR